MSKHGLNLFKHGFRQVSAIFQDPKIKKSQKLHKNQKTKMGEYYHAAEVGKNQKFHGVEPSKAFNNNRKY